MQVFEQAGVARLDWDGALRSLTVEWLSFADAAAFRAVMERALEEVRTRGALTWIAQASRAQGVLSAEEQQYIVSVAPRARELGLRAVVTVPPEASTLGQLSARRWQRNLTDPQWSVVEVATLEEALGYARQVRDAAG